MKVNIIDDNNIIVFLNKFNIKNIDFKNKDCIEKNFRNIFLKLKRIYELNIKGYYTINAYIDEYYGAILEIEHEDIEYFDCFETQVDMHVNVIYDNKFLYKINDIFMLDEALLKKLEIYIFKDEYYINLDKVFNDYEIGKILETGELIYRDITSDILKLGNKINLVNI